MFHSWQGEGFYPCRLEVVSSEFNEYPGSTITIMGGQKVACICRYNCMSINKYMYIYIIFIINPPGLTDKKGLCIALVRRLSIWIYIYTYIFYLSPILFFARTGNPFVLTFIFNCWMRREKSSRQISTFEKLPKRNPTPGTWTAGTWKSPSWKGKSSEPNLHFGVHVNVPRCNVDVFDPAPACGQILPADVLIPSVLFKCNHTIIQLCQISP